MAVLPRRAPRGRFTGLPAAERRAFAHVFDALRQGEALARDGAGLQLALTGDGQQRRFFRRQWREESFHYRLFAWAADALESRRGASPVARSFERYRALVVVAAEEGDLSSTVLGLQVVLECAGDVVLDRIDQGIAARDAGFVRLRRLVLSQEAAHQGFGRRYFAERGGMPGGRPLRAVCEPFVDGMHDMMLRMQSVLGDVDLTPLDYAAEFRSRVERGLAECVR